jgi:hypothetical protein
LQHLNKKAPASTPGLSYSQKPCNFSQPPPQNTQDITALLERTLGGAVDDSLKAGPLVEKLVADAIATYIKGGELEIVTTPNVVKALKAKLAAQKEEITLVTDAQMGTGFRVKLAGGRVEHDFTGASVTDALAALLRPQLAELLKD